MNILSPISHPDEVEMLVKNGAEEFYCGFVPQGWIARYAGALWLNRRSPQGANLTDEETFKELLKKAHSYGVPVYLTLNAPYYTADQMGFIWDLVPRVIEEYGVDALIISDIGLLMELLALRIKINIHLSSIASCLNCEAIEFFQELGVKRIVLPRGLCLEEIANIKTRLKDAIELEVFILNDGCVFEEGLCFTTHKTLGAFCSSIANCAYTFQFKGCQDMLEEEDLRRHMGHFKEWVWYVNGCGHKFSAEGIPHESCGLCAISSFAALGIDALKIVGREISPYRKLASLQLVKAVVDQVRMGKEPKARAMRNTRRLCNANYMCYYR